MNRGILYATGAYLIWGLLPLYLKSLHGLPAMEILLHRMVWSLVFLGAILLLRRQWQWLQQLRNPRLLAGFALSALLLSVNWFIYIWAVQAGRVVDASLGYFINPLVNVLLGVLVLHERLRRGQWLAIALAAAGVLWLTVSIGQLPWIALILALTFGTYGLLRKTASLGALEGLALETALLFPLAATALALLLIQGQSGFISASPRIQLLALLAGPVTAIPLLLFAAGARRITLTQLGLLQYIGPTVQLLLGVLVWHEPFGAAKAAGFALIWGALLLFTFESVWQQRQSGCKL
ncbi:EamA family transporter RarD [Chitinilyticum piscinae]|uniref:EamA family transporter RarD n=1 Tax=Chitinilyticum piscinae TaxID=2866724 RepID=A0A8J7FLT4_9NEIS|nr:EamA family transporter RarD [Chitinilyticum piscinae]MBE9608624.1 EamA family transporter RarD [Chitinilyticum piscinae]